MRSVEPLQTPLAKSTFCVLPWIHLATETTGQVKLCCKTRLHIKRPDGTDYRLGRESFAEAWNSPYMQDVRKKIGVTI